VNAAQSENPKSALTEELYSFSAQQRFAKSLQCGSGYLSCALLSGFLAIEPLLVIEPPRGMVTVQFLVDQLQILQAKNKFQAAQFVRTRACTVN
jgi:hypothetical protein